MHIELLTMGSPIKHKKFIEDVNNWEYELEGNVRKGVYRPLISEWRVYDIRIKEELAPQFMRDIIAQDFAGVEEVQKGWQRKLMMLALKIVRKILGHTPVQWASGERKYLLPDWFYAFTIMCLKDPTQIDAVTKEKKEVL